MLSRLAAGLRSFGTDPEGPLHQGRYTSALRDERLAAILGASLGLAFSVCFLTGLYSHVQQHPLSWFPVLPRPAGLYRVTQGLHVATGIATLPLLLAKLWVVWPRFLSWPPTRGAASAVERLGLLPLVGGGLFLVFSGVANIAQWYPWRFSFPAAHFWTAWITIGAMLAHLGAKWAVTRRALARPSRRPPLAEADPVLGTLAERPPVGSAGDAATPQRVSLSRRGFLGTVAGASGLLTVATVGQTVRPLRSVSVLAPRDPQVGPQGYPVNRGAGNAGVVALATSPVYRLVLAGAESERVLTLDELTSLPSREGRLPIACVEGWSYAARWRGVSVRDLLALVGGYRDRPVLVESLEPQGTYRTSTLDPVLVRDPDALLATHLDGQPLALDHGYPCRLIAPNRPGVLQTRWVSRVVAL